MFIDLEQVSINVYIDDYHIGRFRISGLAGVKVTSTDNLFVVIWSTLRKRIFDKVGLSVVGYFDPIKDEPGAFKGKFYLSYPNDVNAEEHFEKFQRSFPKEMEYFERILFKFFEDPRGYMAYLRVKEELRDEPAEVRDAAAKAAIQNYLRIIRVRKKND